MLTIAEILTDVERVCAAIPMVDGANYPPEDGAPKGRQVAIYWGNEETQITYEMGSELWVAPFVIRVLVAHQHGDSKVEMRTVDDVLQAIQDTFSPLAGRPNDVLQVSGHVDQLRVQAIRASLQTEVAGVACYAGDAVMRLVFRRVRDE